LTRESRLALANAHETRDSISLILYAGCLGLSPVNLQGNLLTKWHQITSLKTSDPRLPYCQNLESLCQLGLIRYQVVTPGQTDGQNPYS